MLTLLFIVAAIACSYGFVHSLVKTITIAMAKEWWTLWAWITTACLTGTVVCFFYAAVTAIT